MERYPMMCKFAISNLTTMDAPRWYGGKVASSSIFFFYLFFLPNNTKELIASRFWETSILREEKEQKAKNVIPFFI